jgi:hypothetical protein
MRPNDDLRDCLSGAAGLVRDGTAQLQELRSLSARQARSLSDAVYAGMSNSIRALLCGASLGTLRRLRGWRRAIAVTQRL